MPSYTDQLHRNIRLDTPPQRIVSLVPSQTEFLYDLGLGDRVAGITKFCVHPAQWFASKTRVGGTKTVKMEIIDRLQPDLIIANKEENVQEQVEELALRYPVWTSDINNIEDAYRMMAGIGELTGHPAEAANIIHTVKSRFLQLPAPRIRRKAAYLIWQNPWMTVGGDTFINDMLQRCGWDNVFADRRRYPAVTPEELAAAGCQLVLLSSEPFPFKEKHVLEWKQRLPGVKILLADGEMFSWYGSRLLHAPGYFMQLQKQSSS
jgi:ABC-type Fe3+-hydroxamate transport system substrate-binding protein